MSQISLAVLVPLYCAEPAPFSKRQAVRLITKLRLSSRDANGKGNRARRRSINHP